MSERYPMNSVPFLPITSNETLLHCKNLLLDNAIFISSYPKSGTTWMQWIIYRLVCYPTMPIAGFHISNCAPFFEIDQHWKDGFQIDSITSNHRRMGVQLFNTHLPWNCMPRLGLMKHIYVVRNGKDVCTSFYHHLSNQADSGGFDGSFREFYHQWLQGSLPYGHWLIHVRDWITASHDRSNNILIIFYEDLIQNLSDCVIKIANHIDVPISDDMLADILPTLTFTYMKDNMSFFQPVSVKWKEGFNFIRKGVVGDSKALFDTEEDSQFTDMVNSIFPITDARPDWLQRVI